MGEANRKLDVDLSHCPVTQEGREGERAQGKPEKARGRPLYWVVFPTLGVKAWGRAVLLQSSHLEALPLRIGSHFTL